jgi:hypothetical protein
MDSLTMSATSARGGVMTEEIRLNEGVMAEEVRVVEHY